MNRKETLDAIEELKPWYQNIQLDEDIFIESEHSKLSGEFAWAYIKQLLPDVKNKRVLDLGSNAGLFSVRCSQAGAEVVSIEREPKHIKQAALVAHYVEEKRGKPLNIHLKTFNLEDLPKRDIGRFDLILAISVLYWVGRKAGTDKYSKQNREREIEFISHLVTLSDRFIVRTRNAKYNNGDYYTRVFENRGFSCVRRIDEKLPSYHSMLLLEKR